MNTAFDRHDHGACAHEALSRAERIAADRGLRLTPVRRRVLEILLERHRALGAYEVLERLASEGLGKQPPVAYRALEFLVENGLAHRIQRLNAFTACVGDHADGQPPAFLICRDCQTVAELDASALHETLSAQANGAGFHVERVTVEALGLCTACAAVAQ
ncbi:Fur family transcriptional regulator, zinc uptake regulator [Paracoccus isoporae]|uniref:Fur family transcriptional regulator, zinc uptake regulator n=1 Tax=Paracoccus isoporae TaxID=591205 RepID=A0A1G7E3I1_9RHOB|nr:transcriptional repressor [Paracoccus isoporae]SDE58169.1 Fur family transcriptional regulator, zinc uptake regulator [Paracoccus isoporae]